MKEKNRLLIDEFLSVIPAEYRNMLNDLAVFADSLGYTPKRNKVSLFSIDFSKSKIKRTIMKFEECNPKISTGIPKPRLKFYANAVYSDVFKDGIKSVIEEFDGKYTGCYGCGRCKDGLEGYTYLYPDGRKIFRCGSELIPIPNWYNVHLDEWKRLIKTQDDFWLSKYDNAHCRDTIDF